MRSVAHEAMAVLTHAQRIRPIVCLGHNVLDAVPHAQRHQPAVADFRDYLAAPDRVSHELR